MTSQQTAGLLGSAHGNISACLDILGHRASQGTHAKPTVAELNTLVLRLAEAKQAIEQAVYSNHDAAS